MTDNNGLILMEEQVKYREGEQAKRWSTNPCRALCCIFTLLMLNGCSVFYVMKQGIYQLKLLSGAEPIEVALRSRDLDQSQRKKLELILDVREFAAKKLKLTTYKNYKDINLEWHKQIHTVSASAHLKFKPYLWWFPIIGSVPYKGFFSEQDAEREEARLKARGFETQKREIHGYSTLGFFSDPVWPAMLVMSDHALIELIIHELAHSTVYIPNQTPFNETFANFVGKKGARAYVENRFGKNSAELKKLDSYNASINGYYKFFHELYGNLDELYNSELSDDDKQSRKSNLLSEAKSKYKILINNALVPMMDWSTVNNAYLLAFKSYNQDYEIFDKLLILMNRDFGKFIDEVNYYGRTCTPFVSLWGRIQRLADQP